MKPRRALLSAMMTFAASIAHADDHDPLFTQSEIASIEGIADEIRQKQRQFFDCSDHETHQACVARHCNLDPDQLEQDTDPLVVLNTIGNFTDEQIKCISTGSDYGEFMVSFRKAFRAGLLDFTKPQQEKKDDQSPFIDQILNSVKDIKETEVSFSPPLTQNELSKFIDDIARCWQTDDDNSNVTVVVAASFTEDAKPILSSIRMISYEGGDQANAQIAFTKARNAIMLCGDDGYGLPAVKFEHWQDAEITFNAQQMRFR